MEIEHSFWGGVTRPDLLLQLRKTEAALSVARRNLREAIAGIDRVANPPKRVPAERIRRREVIRHPFAKAGEIPPAAPGVK